MSTDELIAASAELAERAHGVSDRLAGITGRAAANGIEVTVNLDGMIIAVELSEEALRLPPDRLAAELTRLTHEAAAAALAEGVATLEPVAGEPLLALLTAQEPAPPPESAPTPPADEDFSAIESWALPR
ncbi:MAG TPA: hypothetical protein VFV67_25315 [Actinophytocola sp.]|uniref:hypothetical protein n=1 Tax=Actinophytocola sp. TaxID=1872138 RepID=UPI002DBB138D|nr:hypothetical protein [Actinophytocola sp.]HEU5473979.1 hypothetical protein [Actinophytocola sp.]